MSSMAEQLRIDLISVVPQTFESVLRASILGRAQAGGFVEIVVHNLRDYGLGTYRQVDDTPCGGGAGMILRPEPVFELVEKLRQERPYDEVIYMTPDGERLTQGGANSLSMTRALIILCGHYRGIDQRIRDRLITREISIGDYVLTGGELPALVLVDAIIRLLPGVIGDSESALGDSFQDGLLDVPWYTKPARYRDMDVPEILLSGDHRRIEAWRQEKALDKTTRLRPDLLDEED
jgi:tRNA (guanine37-N1)-methyltransferase